MGQHVIIAALDDIVRYGLQSIFAGDARVSDVHSVESNHELHYLLGISVVDLVVIDQGLLTDMMILPKGKFVIVTEEPDMPTRCATSC